LIKLKILKELITNLTVKEYQLTVGYLGVFFRLRRPLFFIRGSDSARAKVLLEQTRAEVCSSKNQNFYFYGFYVSFDQTSCLEAFKIGFKIKKNFARAKKIFFDYF
jgi:hypothetical protein